MKKEMLEIIEESSKKNGNYDTAMEVAKTNPLFKYLLKEEHRRTKSKKRPKNK